MFKPFTKYSTKHDAEFLHVGYETWASISKQVITVGK